MALADEGWPWPTKGSLGRRIFGLGRRRGPKEPLKQVARSLKNPPQLSVVTLSSRTVVPTAIRTFVLHPVVLLASSPSSKNSAAAPHLRFFRRLFTLPSMVQSSQRGSTLSSTSAREVSPGKAASTTSRNLTAVIGWVRRAVRCSCHVTSTESL